MIDDEIIEYEFGYGVYESLFNVYLKRKLVEKIFWNSDVEVKSVVRRGYRWKQ